MSPYLIRGTLVPRSSVWTKRKFLVVKWTTTGGKLGGPFNIEWSFEVMCCTLLTIFAFVEVLFPSMAKVLGPPKDYSDGSLRHPVDLKVALGDQAAGDLWFCTLSFEGHTMIWFVARSGPDPDLIAFCCTAFRLIPALCRIWNERKCT